MFYLKYLIAISDVFLTEDFCISYSGHADMSTTVLFMCMKESSQKLIIILFALIVSIGSFWVKRTTFFSGESYQELNLLHRWDVLAWSTLFQLHNILLIDIIIAKRLHVTIVYVLF